MIGARRFGRRRQRVSVDRGSCTVRAGGLFELAAIHRSPSPSVFTPNGCPARGSARGQGRSCRCSAEVCPRKACLVERSASPSTEQSCLTLRDGRRVCSD